MKDFIILKILDRFKFLFNKLNIDYPIMRKILQLKFTMDNRRVPTMLSNTKKSENPDKNYFLTSMIFYTFMGFLMILPFVFIKNNVIGSMSFIFGILMFLITSTVIADFSTVLLDIRDKIIISTKPVESKTLSMAKFIHIVHYLLLVSIALCGPGTIAIFIKYLVLEGFIYSSLFTLLFIGEIILLNLFIVVFTTLLYLFILKFFSSEKLKDIINYVQIAMTITISIGYQLIGRVFRFDVFGNVITQFRWYQYFIVPIWFGAPFEVLFESNYNVHYIILSFLLLFIPLLTFMLYLKYIPTFEDNLMKLNQSQKRSKNKVKKWFLMRMITRSKEEEIFYRFGYQMMKSERDFKLKVYPALGLALIFPFIFLFQFMDSLDEIQGSKLYLYIYFCAILLPSAVMMLKFSKNYKAAWVFQAMPIHNVVTIFKGILKAFVVKLLLPIYLVESIIYLALFGFSILPDLIIVFVTLLLFSVICFKILRISFPFSEPFDNANQSQGVIVILFMFIIGIFVLFHLIFTLFNNGIYIYLGIITIANYLAWKYFL